MDRESLKGCASVVLGTLVTMLIVFTGLVGSVFSPEIKTSIASWTPPWLEVVPAFWILVGLSALAFFIHSLVTERRVVAAQIQLQSQIVTLGDSIKLFRSREYAAALERLQDRWISEKVKFLSLIHISEPTRPY